MMLAARALTEAIKSAARDTLDLLTPSNFGVQKQRLETRSLFLSPSHHLTYTYIIPHLPENQIAT